MRVEPDKYSAVVLNANDGSDFDATKPAPQKEVIFGGMPNEEILQAQDELLEEGIYPDRLELGSLAVLGALVDYLGHIEDKTSTLVLEVGPEMTNSYIVSSTGVEASRPIPQGYESMVPLVQKELGLKDAESARKLFFSNTFDFTGMGPVLIKRLTKELQSSIGFYEVQTGQSVGLLYSLLLPQKLAWLDGAIASAMGIRSLKVEPAGEKSLCCLDDNYTQILGGVSRDARQKGMVGIPRGKSADIKPKGKSEGRGGAKASLEGNR